MHFPSRTDLLLAALRRWSSAPPPGPPGKGGGSSPAIVRMRATDGIPGSVELGLSNDTTTTFDMEELGPFILLPKEMARGQVIRGRSSVALLFQSLQGDNVGLTLLFFDLNVYVPPNAAELGQQLSNMVKVQRTS